MIHTYRTNINPYFRKKMKIKNIPLLGNRIYLTELHKMNDFSKLQVHKNNIFAIEKFHWFHKVL